MADLHRSVRLASRDASREHAAPVATKKERA
jgi:hypothetical protein